MHKKRNGVVRPRQVTELVVASRTGVSNVARTSGRPRELNLWTVQRTASKSAAREPYRAQQAA